MSTQSVARPRFISIDEAIAWHDVSLQEYGGLAGIRERALLESALGQPQQQFGGEYAYAFPFGMASAYAWFIAKNHPFMDGNKRTALLCCGGFLRLNGWNLVSQGSAAADAILALVESSDGRADFAAWLESNCEPRPSLELREFFAAINFERFRNRIGSFTKGILAEERLAELLREAATGMPLVVDLDRALQQALESQSEEAALRVQATWASVATLLALYREAEDMGYEW